MDSRSLSNYYYCKIKGRCGKNCTGGYSFYRTFYKVLNSKFILNLRILNLTKDTISKTDPKEYTGSILGIFSKYNYIVEVEDDLNKG